MTPRWTRMELDLASFDDAEFAPYLERCRAAGVLLTTYDDLGDTPTHRRALFELNRTCAADIPGRVEFYTYEEYVEQRLCVPSFQPDGVAIAIEDGAWVGLAATSINHEENYAFSEMTGVLRSHRGLGLSLAMKMLAIDFARRSGMPVLRAFHHPANTPAIAMNLRLGFVILP